MNKKLFPFKKPKTNYYLGLDLGISSVGWAVMAENADTGQHYLHDFGVRIFDIAEKGDSGISHNQQRRKFRSQRRLIRRRAYRITKIKKILEQINFLNEDDFEKNFKQLKSTNKIIKNKDNTFSTAPGYWNPFVVRNKGLEHKLEKWEFYAILIHFCKKRGYLDKSLAEEQEKTENEKTTQFSKAITETEKLVGKKYISNLVLTNPVFWLNKDSVNEKEILLYCKNGKHLKKESSQTNYRFLFAREDYIKELEKIMNTQSKYYPQIGQKKKEIIESIFYQRDFENGPKCKDHYKGKCNPEACSKWKTFLENVGKCTFYPKEDRGFQSSLIFNIYIFVTEINKFLSWLSNKAEINFNKDVYQNLLKNFVINNWKKTEIKKYLSETKIWKEKGSKEHFSTEMWQGKSKSGMNLNKFLFLKTLRKIPFFETKINNINFNDNFVNEMEKNSIQEIGDILNKNITRQRRKTKLQELFKKNNIHLKEDELKVLVDAEKQCTTTAKVSFKHMKKVITDFWNGKNPAKEAYKETIGLDACVKSLKNIDPNDFKKIFSKLIDWDLAKNPVVFRAINQARKILQALHKEYGFFHNINIEMARGVAKSWKERNKINKWQSKNEKRNDNVKDKLNDLDLKNNFTNLLALKLWSDQGKSCLYCGINIPEEKISPSESGDHSVEIDHIIPISQMANDSYQNKVLVHAKCNQEKGQQTPLQYLNKDEKKLFIARIGKLKRSLGWDKYNYLTIKDARELDEFMNKNLSDTRWITKYFLNYVKSQLNHFQTKDKKKTKVIAVPGQITSRLRREWLRNSGWGLDKKVRDITPFHHAIDAIIVAQIKTPYELELASDLVNLQSKKNKWERTTHKYWKEEEEKEYKEMLKSIKLKWQRRYDPYFETNEKTKKYKTKKNYSLIVQEFVKYEKLNQPLYIKDLKNQIETRIPVKLKIEICSCKQKKEEEKTKKPKENKRCLECSGQGRIPKFDKISNEEEWSKEVKKIKETEFINLKFPLISYMVNYKIKNKWSSSENYGFGFSDNGKKKTLYYKIWREDPELKKEWNQKLAKDKHWKKWKKIFEKGEGFIFNEKTGNIILTDFYYGVFLPENKNEKANWIRLIDAQNKIKNKKSKYENIFKGLGKNNLLLKYVNIRYFDIKQNKKIIKTFRNKMGDSIAIHPNHLNFVSNIEKNKNIFENWLNYYDNLTNIGNMFEIVKVDVLGNIHKLNK